MCGGERGTKPVDLFVMPAAQLDKLGRERADDVAIGA